MIKKSIVLFSSLAVIAVSLVTIGLITAVLIETNTRKEAIAKRPLLPVSFEHRDHIKVQCIDCHHNFVDDTGGGTCYACHKDREEIAHLIEPMFHNLCRDCHQQKHIDDPQPQRHAPIRSCSGCHNTEPTLG